MKLYRWTRSELGVTLTEMLMAIATSGILIAAIVSSFISQQKSYIVQTQIADMTVNARAALDRLARDIRLAGYGLPEDNWSDWIDWIKDKNGEPIRFTDPVVITPGTEKIPDQLRLIGAFDRPVAHIPWGASVGDTAMRLRYESGVSRLDSRKRKMIYIGRNEHALVTHAPGRKWGRNLIKIDTDPHERGHQGLAWRYTGTPIIHPVELVSVITYKVVIDRRNYDRPTPVLKRDANTGGGAQPLAEYIEDLRFRREGDIVIITITARTAIPDQNYRHPEFEDGYRRLTLTSHVQLRSL